MIIVEGFDNCGKSTLCKKLVDQFGLKLRTSKRPTSKSEAEDIAEYIINLDPECLLDRCSIFSELVYGPQLRKKNLYGDDIWYWIGRLLETDPLIIYCRPPNTTIFDFGDREQMEGVKEHHVKILNRYDRLSGIISYWPWSGDLEVYDWTRDQSYNVICDIVKSYLRRASMKNDLKQLTIKNFSFLLEKSK